MKKSGFRCQKFNKKLSLTCSEMPIIMEKVKNNVAKRNFSQVSKATCKLKQRRNVSRE